MVTAILIGCWRPEGLSAGGCEETYSCMRIVGKNGSLPGPGQCAHADGRNMLASVHSCSGACAATPFSAAHLARHFLFRIQVPAWHDLPLARRTASRVARISARTAIAAAMRVGPIYPRARSGNRAACAPRPADTCGCWSAPKRFLPDQKPQASACNARRRSRETPLATRPTRVGPLGAPGDAPRPVPRASRPAMQPHPPAHQRQCPLRAAQRSARLLGTRGLTTTKRRPRAGAPRYRPCARAFRAPSRAPTTPATRFPSPHAAAG